MSRCRPTLRTVRNRRLRHCRAPRRNGGFRHWFVYLLPPAGSSQPLASAPSCSEIRPPTRSRPRSHSPRRFGQLRPTARGRLTAALRVFRGPVLCPSPRHRPPRPPSEAALRHPLPHPSTETASPRRPLHPPTDATLRHPLPHPPTDATLRHPLPHPSTEAVSPRRPLHPPTDAASQHPPPHPAPSLMLQRHPPSPPHLTSSPPHQASWRRRPHPRTSLMLRRHPPSPASPRQRQRTPRQLPSRQRLAPGCRPRTWRRFWRAVTLC